jgi:hypothetical protein
MSSHTSFHSSIGQEYPSISNSSVESIGVQEVASSSTEQTDLSIENLNERKLLKERAIKLVFECCLILKTLSDDLKKDPDVVLASVRHN